MVFEIPECSVTVDEAGVIHLTHNRSQATAEAPTWEEAEIQGSILRISAMYGGQIPFHTGDAT